MDRSTARRRQGRRAGEAAEAPRRAQRADRALGRGIGRPGTKLTLPGDGLSLEQIGALVNRHPSTVAYWLRKHDLVANGHDNHSPKGGLPRDELARLVTDGNTLAVIAEAFDVSIRTVRYWIERYELPAPRSNRRSEVDRAIEEGRRTLFRDCNTHGWTVFVIENSGRARCRKCRMERVAEWRRRAKTTLVAENGECQLCGYSRCLAALQFHHLHPEQKSFACRFAE